MKGQMMSNEKYINKIISVRDKGYDEMKQIDTVNLLSNMAHVPINLN